jgi:hypothetical protein
VCGPLERSLSILTWHQSSQCGNSFGPTQVIVPGGHRVLHLSSWNKFGEPTSDYVLEYDFESGVIYEVFFEEDDTKIDWQLYSVSKRRFDEMHQGAPAELRLIPSSNDANATHSK